MGKADRPSMQLFEPRVADQDELIEAEGISNRSDLISPETNVNISGTLGFPTHC